MAMDEDFQTRLLATFRLEAEEHVASITAGLIALETETAPEAAAVTIETVFREAHSLKGAARAVGLADIETICQALEGVLSRVKRGTLPLTPALFDSAHRTVDGIAEIMATEGAEVPNPAAVTALTRALEAAAADAGVARQPAGEASERTPATMSAAGPRAAGAADGRTGSAPAEPPHSGRGLAAAESQQPRPATPQRQAAPVAGAEPPRRAAPQTVRVATGKLDDLLSQGEELVALRLTADRVLEKVRDLHAVFSEWDKQYAALAPHLEELRRPEARGAQRGTGRGAADRQSVRFLEFAASVGERLAAVRSSLDELDKMAERQAYVSRSLVGTVVDDVKKLLMLPFSTVLEGCPKLVRDLSHDEGKQVDLIMTGETIEVDRRILAEMRVVLTHLLRNAVDHGVEQPAARAAKGKAPRGTIRIDVLSGEGNRVQIVVADDGAGIDLVSLRDSTMAQRGVCGGLAGEPDNDELLACIFQSGVSTSPMITDISGRGLGLAIVREKVEALGGRVSMETRPGLGTSFTISLPLTLATFRGVLVAAAGREFVVPTAGVERVLRIPLEAVHNVQDRSAISVNGVALPLGRLADVLELEATPPAEDLPLTVLVLSSQHGRVGCCVDEIVGEQEVIIKGLKAPLVRVRNVAAATILGSGGVVPVLDVSDVVKSVLRPPRARRTRPSSSATISETPQKTILVAEDSITSRMLLKSILETAGYAVVTAVDGVDALARLKAAAVHAVVSDVDMPRMNGFTLTEHIRADADMGELPVVLVTSLSSPEDRERGVDAGASAYIVKSSFDQSNLLEALGRLI